MAIDTPGDVPSAESGAGAPPRRDAPLADAEAGRERRPWLDAAALRTVASRLGHGLHRPTSATTHHVVCGDTTLAHQLVRELLGAGRVRVTVVVARARSAESAGVARLRPCVIWGCCSAWSFVELVWMMFRSTAPNRCG
ncbi:hypothetical protein, partial [Pilimelia columellifera]|uniref:hypothetical protein n=1 Tax=Pilimelia columellifera TaxID=706574 RepID=UPI0031D5D957